MKTQTITSTIIFDAPTALVFETFFKFDQLNVFKNLCVVPRFDYSIGEEYLRPGFEHIIYFENGGTAVRKFITYLPERSFSAVLYDFSSLRYRGLYSIEYSYCFSEDLSLGRCRMESEYHFNFSSGFWAFIFVFFLGEPFRKNVEAVLEKVSEEMHWASVFNLILLFL